MTPKVRTTVIAVAFVALAAAAVAGWMRKPTTASADNGSLYAASPVNYGATPANLATSNPCLTEASYAPLETAQTPLYASYRGYVRTVRERPVVVDEPLVQDEGYADRSRTVVVDRRPIHQRSTKKSVAIVAGSAGAGAAIGAVAGGGKGAGIGALTGGVAGFVYDRLTHKHRH